MLKMDLSFRSSLRRVELPTDILHQADTTETRVIQNQVLLSFSQDRQASRRRSLSPEVVVQNLMRAVERVNLLRTTTLSNEMAGELPSTLGRLASPSADEVGLLGVVSGEGDDDEDDELDDESLISCVDCSCRSGSLAAGMSTGLSSGMGGNIPS